MNTELKLLNILLPSTYGWLVLFFNVLISFAYIELTQETYSLKEFGNIWMYITVVDLLIVMKAFIIKRIYYRVTREKAVVNLVNHLVQYNYPEPSSLGDGNFEWYMMNIMDDIEVDPEVRVDAAKLFATYDAMFPGNSESYLNSSQYKTYSTAIARYKVRFN